MLKNQSFVTPFFTMLSPEWHFMKLRGTWCQVLKTWEELESFLSIGGAFTAPERVLWDKPSSQIDTLAQHAGIGSVCVCVITVSAEPSCRHITPMVENKLLFSWDVLRSSATRGNNRQTERNCVTAIYQCQHSDTEICPSYLSSVPQWETNKNCHSLEFSEWLGRKSDTLSNEL